MDWGRTSAGVPIQPKTTGVRVTPAMVSTVPVQRPKAMAVWMEWLTWSNFFAPKYRAITTPAPMLMPLKKLTNKKIKLPEELTAAKASSLIK